MVGLGEMYDDRLLIKKKKGKKRERCMMTDRSPCSFLKEKKKKKKKKKKFKMCYLLTERIFCYFCYAPSFSFILLGYDCDTLVNGTNCFSRKI